MLRTKWLLQLRAKQYKGALATGAAMVNADTTRADIDYFQRSIAAAGLDSNRAMQQQLIAQAMQKFGDRVPVEFPLVSAQIYCEAGQFQQALARARRASEIDSKKVAAWQLQLSIRNQMNQPDSAVATAQKAIAAGVPKDTLGALLLWQVGAAVKKAEDTKDQPRAAWEAALTSAQQADAILPSQGTKFYVGVAAFQVGLDALQKAQSLGLEARKPGANGKDTFAQACSETMLAEHQWRTVAKAFPAGDAFNKERAAEIYGDMRRQSRSIPQMKKRFCKRK
jgi:tetratricopeptide (TPR) repeat protein